MAFHNVLFPVGVSYGSTGGPTRKTEVVTLGSGYEERNAVWANSRRMYNAGYGLRSVDDVYKLMAFFEARNGRLHSFRMRDPVDYKSCLPSRDIAATDQLIGIGDGATKTFQLVVKYADKFSPYVKTIYLPRISSTRIAIDGVEYTGAPGEVVSWTVSTTNGIITFSGAPADGARITAGFLFDLPVRFDTDQLKINLATFNTGIIPDIPLVEVRLLQ